MKYLYSLMLLLATFMTLPSAAQPSAYYSSKGNKETGHIVFHHPQLQANGGIKPGYITFSEPGRQKNEKISAADLSAFVIGVDSFVVITALKLGENQHKEEEDIVQVLEKGQMNLYLHTSRQGSGNNSTYVEKYVLSLAGTNTYLCIYAFDKQQKEIAHLFVSNPRLKELITNGKVRLETLPNLVKAFNTTKNGA